MPLPPLRPILLPFVIPAKAGMAVRRAPSERQRLDHFHALQLARLVDHLGGDRLVEIFGIGIEADLEGHMLYIVNEDAPGFIGRIGSLMGETGINIGTFHLGRRLRGGEAVLLLSVDQPIPAEVIDKACQLQGVKMVKALAF